MKINTLLKGLTVRFYAEPQSKRANFVLKVYKILKLLLSFQNLNLNLKTRFQKHQRKYVFDQNFYSGRNNTSFNLTDVGSILHNIHRQTQNHVGIKIERK